jgi:hypothetical protein
MFLKKMVCSGLFFLFCNAAFSDVAGAKSLASLNGMESEVTPNCYSYLTELVRSSNFPFKYVKKGKVNLLIDDDANGVVNAQLFFETDGSGEMGWIEYRVLDRKLMNTSADLDEPEELIFDKKYAEKYDECKKNE